jgi:uncharacterized protein (TIGR00730 family)
MSAPRPFSVCVYCGSRDGARPGYQAAARALGQAIGQRGWQMVFGGGRVGLMGITADAALEAGARVVGVIPDSLVRREVGHHGLTELHVVKTMHERKQMMAEQADAFVALPGGLGTFEELFEVWTWRHLGYHAKPLGLLDTEGFYQPLLAFLRHTQAEGFIDASQQQVLAVDADPLRLLDELAMRSAAAGGGAPANYQRI